MNWLRVFIAFVLSPICFSYAADTQPASSPTKQAIVLEGSWDSQRSEGLSWIVIGQSDARPSVSVLDAKIVRSAGAGSQPTTAAVNDSETTITLAQLPAEERDQARSEIQSQVTIEPAGYIRYWQVFKVQMLNVTITSGNSGSSVVYLKLQLDGVTNAANEAPPAEVLRADAAWGFIPVLKELAANGKDAAQLASAKLPGNAEAQTKAWSPEMLPQGRAVFRLVTDKTQFVRILPSHFTEAGIQAESVNPANLRLYSRGVQIPLFLDDNGDAKLDPGESILFYGQESESAYSTSRAYWLVVDARQGEAPQRLQPVKNETSPLPVQPFFRKYKRIEKDEFDVHERGNFLEIREVRWVWSTLTGDKPSSFTFSLPGLTKDDASTNSLAMNLEFYHLPSNTENLSGELIAADQRKVKVSINGHDLGEQMFTSHRDTTKTFAVPFQALKETDNLLSVQLAAQQETADSKALEDGTYFDAVTLDYPSIGRFENGSLEISLDGDDAPTSKVLELESPPNAKQVHAFDITDPEHPSSMTLLKNGKHQLPLSSGRQLKAIVLDTAACSNAPKFTTWKAANLRSAQNAADYLIISHPKFMPELKPLIDVKTSQGFVVKTVSILDVYDEFSAGELTPFAIKRFLLHTLLQWKVRPAYVLLVGDATADYRNALRVNVENLVPSYRENSSENEGESWASDHWYARLIGDDDLPDIILGRLAAVSVEDAREMIRKQVATTQGLPLGPWRNRFLSVTDEEPGFIESCIQLQQEYLPPSLFFQHIDLAKMPWERNWYLDRDAVDAEKLKVSSLTTQAILDAYNRGLAFVAFWGHGAPNIWTDERIWFGMDSVNSDNLLLQNKEQMPLVMNMTCNTGAIDYPKPPYNICISEDMMRVKSGGARTMLVPSGPGHTQDHFEIISRVATAMLKSNLTLQGDQVLLGKARYLFAPTKRVDYARMYQLLGDPALPMLFPREAMKIDANPAMIDLRQKHASINATLREVPFASGQIVFQLAPPAKSSRAPVETPPMAFSANQTFAISLPPSPDSGEWKLKAYIWNNELKREASGVTSILIDTPYGEIEEFKVVAGEGRQKLEATFTNPSVLPLKDLRFEISEKQGGQYQKVGSGSVDIDAGQTKSWTMDFAPRNGALHELRLTLLNGTKNGTLHSSKSKSREIAWCSVEPSAEVSFALSSIGITREFRHASSEVEVDVQVPVYVTAGNYSGPLEIGWGWGDQISATDTIQVTADQKTFTYHFTARADAASLPKPFVVEVDPAKKVMKNAKQPVRLTSTLDLKALPNLTVDAKRGLAIEPRDPSDAQTVIFRVPVVNRGAEDAGFFRVTAYENSPTSGGLELNSRVGNSFCDVEGLAAGSSMEAVIRWDPEQSAGEKKIYFKIDSMDRIVESSEKDNLASYPMKIRTLAKLEQVSFEIDKAELLRSKRVRVTATIRNTGQTEAHNIILAFFKDREGAPENKMGEKFIERIGPEQSITEMFEWPMPQTSDGKVHACAQIYLRGSMQRVTLLPSAAMPSQ